MKNSIKNIFDYSLSTAFSVVVILLIILYPHASTHGAMLGLKLCAQIVIPSLFPICALVLFLFSTGITNIISDFSYKIGGKKLREITELSLLFVASFTGGFPIGSIMLSDAVEKLQMSKECAIKMLYCCVNAGPAFIILTVGNGVLRSAKLGRLLFFCSLIASTLIFIFIVITSKTEMSIINKKPAKTDIYNSFINSVYKAVVSILSICGYVVLFSSVISVFSQISDKYGIIKAALPFLEITNGIILLSNSHLKIAFLTAFGGLCVHFQVLSNCSNFSPSFFKFEISRLFHAVLTTALFFITLKIYGITIPTISNGIEFTPKVFYISLAEGISLCLLSVALIFSIKQKISGGKYKSYVLK